MKTHVDNVHSHLIAKKKSTLSERAMVKLFGKDHIQQHGKQRVGPTSFAITIFLVSINPNIVMKQKRFMEDLVLYIYKGYILLSTCENVLFHRLILCQCPCVVFRSWSSLVEQVFCAMAIETMELYVFHIWNLLLQCLLALIF